MTQPLTSPSLISVIVPVYNVAPYVEAALTSLRNQTLTDFEAIVVDDGSTDGSGHIVARVIADDPRFRLIRQENRGLSGARNTGLEHAQGAFVAFLDSDDQLAPDYLMHLWQALEDTGADWVACAVRLVFSDGNSTTHSAIHGVPALSAHPVQRSYRLECWADVSCHFPSAWNKLYRASLIEGLRFDEGTWFEDHSFFHRAACRTEYLLHLPEPLYLHSRDRDGQITNQDDDRIHEQFDVLRRIHRIMQGSLRPGAPEGFARIASRLLWERSMALKDPVRRAEYAAQAAAFLVHENIDFTQDWDRDIARTWEMEMAGELPLSVVLPWNGKNHSALVTTLASIHNQIGPGREVLVVCPESTAVELVQEWKAVRILTENAADLGRAWTLGLQQARGKYVLFLTPGDHLHPAALHGWCNLIEDTGSDCALTPFHQGTGSDAPLHSGFDDMEPFQGVTLMTGAISLSPMMALSAAPILSNRLFRRAFLLERGLTFTRGANSHWALDLTTLMTGRMAYFDQAVLRRNTAPALRPPRAGALTGSHAALLQALPETVTSRLPDGWQRRLYARALWSEVNQTDHARSALATPWFGLMLTRAALGAVTRGYTGATRDSAGFDPNFGPRLARLLNPISLIGGPSLQPHAPGPGDPEFNLPRARANDHSMFAFPLDGARGGLIRFRVDSQVHSYANLSFFAEDGISVPFHISLRFDEERLVCNDTRVDGSWRTERVQPLQFPPEGLELTIALSATGVTVRIGREIVLHSCRRSMIHRQGFSGFNRITWVGIQGAVLLIDILPALPPATLELDARLQLRAATAPAGVRLVLHPMGKELPLTATTLPEGGVGLVADLLGRLWRDVPNEGCLELELTGLPPLRITRTDMAARIDQVLTHPPDPADSTLVLSMLDHLRHGALHSLIRPESRIILNRLARFYGLSDYMAAAVSGSPAAMTSDLAPATDTTVEMIDAALTRFHHSQQIVPTPDPFDILAEVALPPDARRGFFLGLTDVFCRDAENGGGDVDRLCQAARDQGVDITTLPQDFWSLSACLPFLYSEGQFTLLDAALARLERGGKGWILTPPLAWVLRRTTNDPALPDDLRNRFLDHGMQISRRMARDYWERAHCRELTLAAVEMLMAPGSSADQAKPHQEAETFCLEVYGLSRLFWNLLAERQDTVQLSPRMISALAQFAGLMRAIEAGNQDQVDSALGFFESVGALEAPRIRVELLGPAGLPGPVTVRALQEHYLSDPEDLSRATLPAMRHLAFPTAQVTPELGDLARQALPALYPETPRAPDLDGQLHLAEILEALL
ncbi:glycosyltransferase, partial [Pseudophaeobacter sp.]